MDKPVLYSFRRCPYAMRARYALAYSGVQCYLREVDLKHKPQAMLELSPKGTVPVFHLPDGRLIDESLDIIHYALKQNDPDGWTQLTEAEQQDAERLIQLNDNEFTKVLRKYKYFERYPEFSQKEYRAIVEGQFLQLLESQLAQRAYLVSDHISYADVALFPFIRQCAFVDEAWFFDSEYQKLAQWLRSFIESDIFQEIMKKQKPWQEGDEPLLLLP